MKYDYQLTCKILRQMADEIERDGVKYISGDIESWKRDGALSLNANIVFKCSTDPIYVEVSDL